MLKRELWHTGRLKDWDELLRFFSRELALHALDFKLSLSQSPVTLDLNRFGPLPEILDQAASFPDMDLTDVLPFSNTSSGDSASDSGLRPWELMAIQDMVMQYFPEAMESGFLELDDSDSTGLVKITSSLTNHTIGVRLVDNTKDFETILLPEPTVLETLAGIWLLLAAEGLEALDEEDPFIIPVRSMGFIPRDQITQLKPSVFSKADEDGLRMSQIPLQDDDWFHLLVPVE